MKEKIYTIPLNDSFDIEEGCAFCYLENKLERNLIDYTLGPSMMEPDSREMSNKTGFCKNHLHMMLKENKRLSLALMLSTHLEYIQGKLSSIPIDDAKKGLFKKKAATDLSPLTACISGCVICDSISHDMNRYINVFYDMWGKEAEFRKKVEKHKELCVYHGITLLNNMPSEISLLKAEIIRLLHVSLSDNITELKAFIDIFDYRNEVPDPSRYKNAVPNAASNIRGNMKNM